jgi:hypothetical protein
MPAVFREAEDGTGGELAAPARAHVALKWLLGAGGAGGGGGVRAWAAPGVAGVS